MRGRLDSSIARLRPYSVDLSAASASFFYLLVLDSEYNDRLSSLKYNCFQYKIEKSIKNVTLGAILLN